MNMYAISAGQGRVTEYAERQPLPIDFCSVVRVARGLADL